MLGKNSGIMGFLASLLVKTGDLSGETHTNLEISLNLWVVPRTGRIGGTVVFGAVPPIVGTSGAPAPYSSAGSGPLVLWQTGWIHYLPLDALGNACLGIIPNLWCDGARNVYRAMREILAAPRYCCRSCRQFAAGLIRHKPCEIASHQNSCNFQ